MPVESCLVPEVVGAAAGATNRLADLVLAAHVKPEVLLALEHPVAELACELKQRRSSFMLVDEVQTRGFGSSDVMFSAMCLASAQFIPQNVSQRT